MKTPPKDPVLRASVLSDMNRLGSMKRGKLTSQRRPSGKEYHHYQVWENGRNRTRYVPAEEVPALRAAIEERRRFERLVEQFIDASAPAEQDAQGKKNSSN